ncbi:nucleoside-diphosphate kinase [Thalassospira xianhensis]|uniref:nucleoside-diphosphate kinase n=1 Tax=Thalassospira xianhensis TaxID=478503 RepID=UPI000DEDB6FE|nr:nucleoside-diphosphate kinase [Thalassospira xianhensis]
MNLLERIILGATIRGHSKITVIKSPSFDQVEVVPTGALKSPAFFRMSVDEHEQLLLLLREATFDSDEHCRYAGVTVGGLEEPVNIRFDITESYSFGPGQHCTNITIHGITHTILLVKSAAVARGQANDIVSRVVSEKFVLGGLKSVFCFNRDTAALFYREHTGRPYFERLLRSVTDGPVVACKLCGVDPVNSLRALLGPTDPQSPDGKGTIRGDFGTELPDNAAHGSDSDEAAAYENRIIWPLMSTALIGNLLEPVSTDLIEYVAAQSKRADLEAKLLEP